MTHHAISGRCLLCHRRPNYAGFFIPHRPTAFGGRAVHVQLCERCRRKGKRHWTRAVEADLARRAAAQRN